MPPATLAAEILAIQNAIQALGDAIYYTEAGGAVDRPLKARVVFLGATELANAIEAYPVRVTVDARDFAAREPLKGDTVTVRGARRGVMQVTPIHVTTTTVAYRLGVQG